MITNKNEFDETNHLRFFEVENKVLYRLILVRNIYAKEETDQNRDGKKENAKNVLSLEQSHDIQIVE